MTDFDKRLDKVRSQLNQKYGKAKAVEADIARVSEEIERLELDIDAYSKAIVVLNSVGDQRQKNLQNSIEQLVTKGLQSIFAPNLSFHIVQTTKGNNQSIEFIIRTATSMGTFIDTSVMSARGGGMVAVVSFLLRIVMLLLSPRVQKTKLLFLDEAFSHLSEDYIPLMAGFLRDLVDKTGIQIILVTHTPALGEEADVTYHLSLKNEVTQIRRLK